MNVERDISVDPSRSDKSLLRRIRQETNKAKSFDTQDQKSNNSDDSNLEQTKPQPHETLQRYNSLDTRDRADVTQFGNNFLGTEDNAGLGNVHQHTCEQHCQQKWHGSKGQATCITQQPVCCVICALISP